MEVSELFEVMKKATENIPETVILRVTNDPREEGIVLEWHVLVAGIFQLGYVRLALSERLLSDGCLVAREVLGEIKTRLEQGFSTYAGKEG